MPSETVEFTEARGGGRVKVKAAGGRLQYSVNGSWRPAFRQMTFLDDGLVQFPEIGKSAKLPDAEAAALRAGLQDLARSAGIGMQFQEVRTRNCIRVSIAGDAHLQYTANGAWRPPFCQMAFQEKGLLVFADIGKTAQLNEPEACAVRSTLQELACMAGAGVRFQESRGKGALRFTVAGDGCLQYSVDGLLRPTFQQMEFQEDGLVDFLDIGKTAKLPVVEASALRIQLQELACRAGIGVQFPEARGNGYIRVTVAGDARLQYTVDGAWRPAFRHMMFHEDGSVSFPELGKTIAMPVSESATLRSKLQDLARLAGLGVKFQGACGERLVRVTVAGPGRLQYSVDGSWRPTFRHMTFHEDGLVYFPELNKTVQLPESQATTFRIMLQELAHQAGIAVQFKDARGKASVRVTLAGDCLLQYTVDGTWRPTFREMVFQEDDLVDFPEISRTAKLPAAEAALLRVQLQDLASQAERGGSNCIASATSAADEQCKGASCHHHGHGLWLVVDAGSTQLMVDE